MTEDVRDDGADDRAGDDHARDDQARDGHGRDGRAEAFRPVRGWGVLWRSAFVLWHGGHEYVVDVDFLDWDERIRLYRDRRLVDEQRSRARFDLPGARIEARMSLYGMRYVRVVDAVGDVRDVPPMPGTAEAWRDRMDRERPTASRAVGVAAWVVLVVALVTQVPQASRPRLRVHRLDAAVRARPARLREHRAVRGRGGRRRRPRAASPLPPAPGRLTARSSRAAAHA